MQNVYNYKVVCFSRFGRPWKGFFWLDRAKKWQYEMTLRYPYEKFYLYTFNNELISLTPKL